MDIYYFITNRLQIVINRRWSNDQDIVTTIIKAELSHYFHDALDLSRKAARFEFKKNVILLWVYLLRLSF